MGFIFVVMGVKKSGGAKLKKPDSGPQLENGYIRIATEIWTELTRYRLSGEEMKCLMFIIRQTYGWNKKSDAITLSQFSQATDMVKQCVCRALKRLSDKNLIFISKIANERVSTYRFNKRYGTWKPLAKPLTLAKQLTTVSGLANATLAKQLIVPITDTTIDTITKDKLHRRNRISKIANAIMRHLNRKKGSRYRDVTQIKARLKDGASAKECITVINNKFADPYFKENRRFLNPTTLFRKSHFDKYLNDIPDPLEGRVSAKTQQNIRTLKQWEQNGR